jgi:FlaA1/EpsC-like NDP-sugar epimerase
MIGKSFFFKELFRSVFGGKGSVVRTTVLTLIYSGAIIIAHWLAYLIRFEFHPTSDLWTQLWKTLEWAVPVELLLLFVFGQFRSLLSYFSLPDASRIAMACAASGFVSIAVWYRTTGDYAPARSIIILCVLLDTTAIGAIRLSFRMLRERQDRGGVTTGRLRRMVIVGAGDVGANLAKEMKLRRNLHMIPVAFFDDDPAKWETRLHGVPILGRPELLQERPLEADEAVIAMPGATGRRVREVVQVLNKAGLQVEIVPSVDQIMSGTVKVTQIRPVEIEDLLGREKISLETQRIGGLLGKKVVMITGAGGSIGSELCRQIAAYGPDQILLVERCEVQIFPIEQELIGLDCPAKLVPLVADVLDEQRMRGIFEQFRPHVVFHAAAHKHVPMMEHQPFEAFRNNTLGTKQIMDLCAAFDVERFVLISTDKAVNPTNAMGATKRLAELYLQALQQHNGSKTKFMAVRFGNVLGSSGSVIPTFKRQIAAGGPVTVTHPDVVRYFMTIPEAVGLVLQSAVLGKGGEIFVLDMGKLVKIVDLARQLIELSGLRPDLDIEIKFTGLRPGEKLFEEINHHAENMLPTDHPKILRFVGKALPYEVLLRALIGMRDRLVGLNSAEVKLEFQKLVPEYTPDLSAGFDSTMLRAKKGEADFQKAPLLSRETNSSIKCIERHA